MVHCNKCRVKDLEIFVHKKLVLQGGLCQTSLICALCRSIKGEVRYTSHHWHKRYQIALKMKIVFRFICTILVLGMLYQDLTNAQLVQQTVNCPNGLSFCIYNRGCCPPGECQQG